MVDMDSVKVTLLSLANSMTQTIRLFNKIGMNGYFEYHSADNSCIALICNYTVPLIGLCFDVSYGYDTSLGYYLVVKDTSHECENLEVFCEASYSLGLNIQAIGTLSDICDGYYLGWCYYEKDYTTFAHNIREKILRRL